LLLEQVAVKLQHSEVAAGDANAGSKRHSLGLLYLSHSFLMCNVLSFSKICLRTRNALRCVYVRSVVQQHVTNKDHNSPQKCRIHFQ
jgi:hypothetical protein